MKISGYARVRVALTQAGVEILNKSDQSIMDCVPTWSAYADELADRIAKRQAGDIYEADLWTFMSEFGPHISVGCMLPFCGGDIEIIDAETHKNDLKKRMYKV